MKGGKQTMIKRIIQTREYFELSQEKFASRLGLSRNFINQVENGKKNLSDRTISDICREFNVNEEWLRTGEGEMFNDMDSLDIIHNHFGYMLGNASARKKAVLAALVEMAYSVPDDKWDYIFQQFNNCLREAREDEEN